MDWYLLRRIKDEYLPSDLRGLGGAIANWAIVLLGLFAERGATALMLIVVARKVLPIEYGQYLSSYGLAGFLIVLPDFGLEAWLLTKGHSTPSQMAQLTGSAFRSRVQLLSVWMVAMLLLAAILPADTFPLGIMVPTVLGVAFDSLVLLLYSALRSTHQHRRVTFFQSIASLTLLGVTLVLPLGSGRIALFAVGRCALSAALLITVIVTTALDYLKLPLTFIPTRELLLAARPFVAAEIASFVYVKADLAIISLLLGSSGSSVYGPALNLLQVSFIVPRSLFFFVVPVLSRSYFHARDAFMKKGMAQFIVQALIGAIISVTVFLFAPFVVDLVFGHAYARSAEVLRLLSPIPFLRSINFALGAMLTSGERQPQRTKVQVVCAVFNVLANLVVITPFGVAGVAIVYVLSELILSVGYSFLTFRCLGTGCKQIISA